MTSKQLIDNWYIGDKKAGVPPFYCLTAKHVEHLGTQTNKRLGRMKLRQMKSVMKVVERLIREKVCFRDRFGNTWDTENTKGVWDTGSPIILCKYGPKNRKAEMSWKTVYNNMSEAKTIWE